MLSFQLPAGVCLGSGPYAGWHLLLDLPSAGQAIWGRQCPVDATLSGPCVSPTRSPLKDSLSPLSKQFSRVGDDNYSRKCCFDVVFCHLRLNPTCRAAWCLVRVLPGLSSTQNLSFHQSVSAASKNILNSHSPFPHITDPTPGQALLLSHIGSHVSRESVFHVEMSIQNNCTSVCK